MEDFHSSDPCNTTPHQRSQSLSEKSQTKSFMKQTHLLGKLKNSSALSARKPGTLWGRTKLGIKYLSQRRASYTTLRFTLRRLEESGTTAESILTHLLNRNFKLMTAAAASTVCSWQTLGHWGWAGLWLQICSVRSGSEELLSLRGWIFPNSKRQNTC